MSARGASVANARGPAELLGLLSLLTRATGGRAAVAWSAWGPPIAALGVSPRDAATLGAAVRSALGAGEEHGDVPPPSAAGVGALARWRAAPRVGGERPGFLVVVADADADRAALDCALEDAARAAASRFALSADSAGEPEPAADPAPAGEAILRCMFGALLDDGDALLFVKRRDGAVIAANRRWVDSGGRTAARGPNGGAWPEPTLALRPHEAAVFETGAPFFGPETVALPGGGGVARVMSSKVLAVDPTTGDDVLCCMATDLTALLGHGRWPLPDGLGAEIEGVARSRFLSAISHEVRTPMNGVLGMLALLSTTELTEGQTRMVAVARDSAAGLMALLSDVLDHARMDAELHGLALEPRPFNLRVAITAATAALRADAAAKNLSLTMRFADEAPKRALGDAAGVRRVVGALVGNAIKFTEHGGVVVETAADDGAGALRVSVRDTGVGLSPEQAGAVFGRFAQADGSATRRHGGVGLGLTLSKLLVERMGGEIGVDSAPRQGSTFWFRIPSAPPHDDDDER